MDSWIFQGGHPLVTASADGSEVLLTQEPFSYLPAADRPARLTAECHRLELARPGGDAAVGVAQMSPSLRDSTTSCCASSPFAFPGGRGMLVVNAGGSGVYRLRYEDELLEGVLAGFDRLEPLERFRLVADTWACTLAGSAPVEQFLALVRRLAGEKDPSVWTMVAGALGLLDFAVADGDRPALEAFIQSLLGPELERVGWDRQDDDDGEAAGAVRFSSEPSARSGPILRCGPRAGSASPSSDRGASLDADTASAILHVVATTAGRPEYEALLAAFPGPVRPDRGAALPRLAQLRPRPGSRGGDLRAVPERDQEPGCSLSPARLLTNRVAGPQVWDFVSGHWDTLLERYPANSITRMLEVSRLCQLDPDGTPGLSRTSHVRSAPRTRSAASKEPSTRASSAWQSTSVSCSQHRSLLGAILAKA